MFEGPAASWRLLPYFHDFKVYERPTPFNDGRWGQWHGHCQPLATLKPGPLPCPKAGIWQEPYPSPMDFSFFAAPGPSTYAMGMGPVARC